MLNKVVSSLRKRLSTAVPILLTLVSTLFVSNSTFAAQVTLVWNASSDPNVTGYDIYYGVASRSYTNKIDVGNTTNATISGLVEGVTYYFAATAYNVLGIESDFSGEVSYTVPVSGPAPNNPPTLNTIANVTINEDAGLQTVNLSGITSGATNENQTLTVTAVSSDTTIIPTPSVSYTSPSTTGSLSFTPVPNANGQVTITVTVDDGQTNNNLFTRKFTVTVNAVNDRPTLDPISNVTINEDAGLQTVNLTGISSGAPNEIQTLSITTSSSNPGLIPAPTVNYTSPNATGSLNFAPVANSNGVATISVTVSDGSLTTNRTFTVTVNAVNDPPTLNPLSDFTINSGAGLQTVTLGGITAGAPNEFQILTITAISSNLGVIPVPTINYTSPNTTGTLTFTPVAAAHGSSTITVTVSDGQLTTNRSFTVTVNGIPTITAIPNQLIATNSSTGPLSFTVADFETPASALVVTASSTLPSLIPTNNIVLGGANNDRTVTVTPVTNKTGTATITITVNDGTTTASTSFLITVLGAPTPPGGLQLIANGGGSIVSSVPMGKMKAGGTYTATAVPDVGQEFTGWSGDVNSSSPKISFIMKPNLVLQANFIPSPFLPIIGNYNGLFYEEDEARVGHSGSFTVSVKNHGVYTGSLMLGAKKYTFSGKLGFDNTVATIVKSKKGAPLYLNLQVGTNDQTGQIFGQLTDGNWNALLHGDRSSFSGANPTPAAGKYTMMVAGQSGDSTLPGGHGYGTLKINPTGAALFAGVLADGTKVVQSGRLSDTGEWPFFIPLYGGRGEVISWITFTNRANDDFNGNLDWIKPAGAGKIYPAGFTDETTTIGSRYYAPMLGSNILNLVNAEMDFADGNISNFTNTITLGAGSKVFNASANKLTMKFTLKTGLFSGAVTDPATGISRAFSGAVLEKMNSGYGFMLGTSESSQVIFAP
jgi:hypothetical protein